MILSSHRVIPADRCSSAYLQGLTIDNPALATAKRGGYSTRGIPATINLYQQVGENILIPRNYPYLPPGITPGDFEDMRVNGQKVTYDFKIQLREKQIPAVEALAKTDGGILVAPCGSGKTIMGTSALAKLGTTTLILVHKEFLLGQWQEAVEMVTGEKAGVVQGATWDWRGKKVVIAMLQTLYSQMDKIPNDFINYFGLVISDEVHRISAPTWSQVIALFPAKRRWGLTATPTRGDHLEMIFHYHIGPIVHTIVGSDLMPKVVMYKTKAFVPTSKYCNRAGQANMAKLITALTNIEDRNKKLLRLLIDASKSGRKIILLTDRVAHAQFLKDSFDLSTQGSGITTSLYIGAITDQDVRKHAEEADVIFATTQIAKEALNIPELDTLFLTSPCGSKITVQQAAGRILRDSPDKMPPMVVDLVDNNIQCLKLAEIRYRIYQSLKYPIEVV